MHTQQPSGAFESTCILVVHALVERGRVAYDSCSNDGGKSETESTGDMTFHAVVAFGISVGGHGRGFVD
jgi:hypothetical protein